MFLKNKINSILFFFKPRKIVAQYKLFFGDEWLEASVNSIADNVYKILFVVSDVAWGDNIDNPTIKGDNLDPILKKLTDRYPSKVVIIRGSWNEQITHVQAGLDYIKGNISEATHCFYVDADEIYNKSELKKLFKLLFKPQFFNRAIRIQYNLYFHSINYLVQPQKWPTALVLFPVRDYVNYLSARNNVSCKIIDIPEIKYEHPAYVRKDDEKMRLKIEAHRETEPIIGDWYNNVWLKWTPEMTNFHPTHPEFWEKVLIVEKEHIPIEMLKEYESWNQSKK